MAYLPAPPTGRGRRPMPFVSSTDIRGRGDPVISGLPTDPAAVSTLPPSPPPTVTWPEKLREAQTEAEVVGVVRDFLALVGPEEIVRIPLRLRPDRIVDGEDIVAYGVELVRHECADQEGRQVVQKLARIMSHASVRLSEIKGLPPKRRWDDHPVRRYGA
jgi:hypothetical protein